MKTRGFAIALLAAFAAPAVYGQTPAKQPDAPDALQALLAEVRQLRQAIEAMTVASQRVQIALYNLQMQDAAATRSAQRLDEVRGKCAAAESVRQHTAADVQRLETALASGTLAEIEKNSAQAILADRRTQIDSENTEVQACQVTQSEAESQLRNDQAKLADAQERIGRWDKELEKAGAAGK